MKEPVTPRARAALSIDVARDRPRARSKADGARRWSRIEISPAHEEVDGLLKGGRAAGVRRIAALQGDREVVVAVTAGKLDFGPWEQIFYGEFDGRRKKRVLVKIIGD